MWLANKTGGEAEFCIKVSNFLEEEKDPFARQIHFLEVTYKVEVDSLTDFNHTIDIARTNSISGGVDIISYEEEITVYHCEDNYDEILSPPSLTQGDFFQLCVETASGSSFGIHSIKELDVSQDNIKLYPFINGFVPSQLCITDCTRSNTTGAICRAKMQLLAAYFDSESPNNIFASGTVKLDYIGHVGRRLLDVPIQIPMANKNKKKYFTDDNRHVLEKEDKTMSTFGLEAKLANTKDENTSVFNTKDENTSVFITLSIRHSIFFAGFGIKYIIN